MSGSYLRIAFSVAVLKIERSLPFPLGTRSRLTLVMTVEKNNSALGTVRLLGAWQGDTPNAMGVRTVKSSRATLPARRKSGEFGSDVIAAAPAVHSDNPADIDNWITRSEVAELMR